MTDVDVAQVHDWAREYRETDFRRGGAIAREGAVVQLIAAAELLKVSCPDRLRTPLRMAVGDLAEAAGYAAFDAGRWKEAQGAWQIGLRSAPVGSSLWAQLQSSVARQEIWRGRPQQGVVGAGKALEQAQDLSARQMAELWAVRGLGLAAMGRVVETCSAIDNADDFMAEAEAPGPAIEPGDSWVYEAMYDEAMHSGVVAQALTDLVVTGDPPASTGRHLTELAAGRQVVAMLGASQPRSAVLARITGATIVMAAGNPERAVQLGHEAIDATSIVRSDRALHKLHKLRDVAVGIDRTDVADLRARIGSLS